MVSIFKVRSVKAVVENGKLGVQGKLQELPEGQTVSARLPSREVAALIPREIIIGDEKIVQTQIIDTLDDMLAKLVTGRLVRTWEFSGEIYFNFLKWGSVKFEQPQLTKSMH